MFFWCSILLSSVLFPLHESEARAVGFSLTIQPLSACQNGVDDDTDGLVDYPDDTGCESLEDTDEAAVSSGTPGSGGSSYETPLPEEVSEEPVKPEEPSVPADLQLWDGNCTRENASDAQCIIQRSESDENLDNGANSGTQPLEENNEMWVPGSPSIGDTGAPLNTVRIPPKQAPPRTTSTVTNEDNTAFESAPENLTDTLPARLRFSLSQWLLAIELFLTDFFNALWNLFWYILMLIWNFVKSLGA